MENIEGLLFDADGTLIDTYDIILASMDRTVNGLYGGNATVEELMHGVGTPLFEQMLTLAGGDEQKANRMVDDYRAHNDSIHDEGIKSFPDTKDALSRFKQAGYRMGVITSKRHEMAVRGLEVTGILDFFEFVIGSDDWPEHKPEPGPILHGCDLLGTAPERCMYIGDSPYDIQAGNAAGCETVAALWGMFPKDALEAEHPDMECDSLSELADRIA